MINSRNHRPEHKTVGQIAEDADTVICVAHHDGDVVMMRMKNGIEEWIEIWTPEEAEDISRMIQISALEARRERAS